MLPKDLNYLCKKFDFSARWFGEGSATDETQDLCRSSPKDNLLIFACTSDSDKLPLFVWHGSHFTRTPLSSSEPRDFEQTSCCRPYT